MDLAARARASGSSIALASGDFDPFHVGHVRYLQASAREADVLVVAIPSEAAAPAGGGPFILEPEHRAEVIAALRCVDVVTLLGEPGLHSLVSALRPDVYCQNVHEDADPAANALVAAYGGRVAIVGDPGAPSNEDVLARLASAGDPRRTSAP